MSGSRAAVCTAHCYMPAAWRCVIYSHASTDRRAEYEMSGASNARTYEQEQRYWVNQLRDDEVAFANLHINKPVTGYTDVQCYQLTHARCKSAVSAHHMAARMLNTFAVEKYIESMRDQSLSDTIMSIDELKEDLTIQVKGYDFLFKGIVTWEDTPEGRIAFVDKLSDVPESLRQYVNGYKYHEESEGYELFLREYPGRESDRNKARELLAKMQGGLIEKRDLTVRGAILTEKIKDDTTAEEAAKIYKRFMREG